MPAASELHSLCSVSRLLSCHFPEVASPFHSFHNDAPPRLLLPNCFIIHAKKSPCNRPSLAVQSASAARRHLKTKHNYFAVAAEDSHSSSQAPQLNYCRTSPDLEHGNTESDSNLSNITRRNFGARALSYVALLPVTLDFSGCCADFLLTSYLPEHVISVLNVCFCTMSEINHETYCKLQLKILKNQALGDPTLRIEDVTPPITPAGKLQPIEERTIDLFEKTTYSVVNVFDASLRPQLKQTGMVEIPEGNGSGIVWDTQGHIVTNYHVIGSALSNNPAYGQAVARVTLLNVDGSQKAYAAILVGADKTKDLAVLKIDCPPEVLRPVTLGQSSKLRVGQRCLAIGNPFGFDHTLTVGVISGLNRDISTQVGGIISGSIQTDAAINPGNSGGPLVDSSGNVIGINTAIFTRSGTSAGVSFAIPVDVVAKTVPQLIMFGKVLRPGLNVQLAPDSVAKQLNVKNGALVLSAPETSAAGKAGLLPTKRGLAGNIILGDVIVAINNVPIKTSLELSKILDDYQVGDQVFLKVERDNNLTELSFRLEESNQ
ncbi:hypothetical protein O6H91_03G101900 [Diphasiastrum complanatum]|uniref:Uncharacterized protein n=2 Tax=Diphasiastrum complanatum TaxID=34168 RepID=A0ACC2E9R2_DIPCM|nr:hypothetical protein O6H91_03G101900 [Diphasiastrum complanatum]